MSKSKFELEMFVPLSNATQILNPQDIDSLVINTCLRNMRVSDDYVLRVSHQYRRDNLANVGTSSFHTAIRVVPSKYHIVLHLVGTTFGFKRIFAVLSYNVHNASITFSPVQFGVDSKPVLPVFEGRLVFPSTLIHAARVVVLPQLPCEWDRWRFAEAFTKRYGELSNENDVVFMLGKLSEYGVLYSSGRGLSTAIRPEQFFQFFGIDLLAE